METKTPYYLKWVIAGLIAYSLLFTFLNINQREISESYRLNLERTEKKLIDNDKRIRKLQDSLWQQDLMWMKTVQAEKIRADRTEEKLQIANEKLKTVRFVRFADDSSRTSAIKELYPSVRNR